MPYDPKYTSKSVMEIEKPESSALLLIGPEGDFSIEEKDVIVKVIFAFDCLLFF